LILISLTKIEALLS